MKNTTRHMRPHNGPLIPKAGRRLLCLLATLLVAALPLYAQERPPYREIYITWEDFVDEYILSDLPAEDDEDGGSGGYHTELLMLLEELRQAPINLNTATRADLLRLPFVSEAQADSLLAYRVRRHGLRTLGELMFVRGLDYDVRRYLSLFAYAGDTVRAPEPLLRRFYAGRHEVETRMDFPLYRREGNKYGAGKTETASPTGTYLGNGLANTTRYRYRWRQEVNYGLTLQKDAGEPFGSYGTRPYDYVSFYLSFKPTSERFELFAGDFNMRMGQGLVAGNDFFRSKAGMALAEGRTRSAITMHTSTGESDFMRGVAGTLRLGHWHLMAFASRRKVDGRLVGDTLTAVRTDGMHRTLTEIERKNVAAVNAVGARVEWRHGGWSIGGGGLYAHYDKTIWPTPRPYNLYYLRGKEAANFSADYSFGGRRWSLKGEVAFDKGLHAAVTNTVAYRPCSSVGLTLQERSFSPRYVSPFGATLQEGSRLQNEHGVLLGVAITATKNMQILGFVDYFRFPRPTFRADSTAQGLEAQVQATRRLRRGRSLLVRYRMKTKQQNVSGYKGILEYAETHRLRVGLDMTGSVWSSHVALDASLYRKQSGDAPSLGAMVSGRLRYAAQKVSAQGFLAVFFTDDYFSRLYAYTPLLRNTAAFPSFYYHGCNAILTASWNISKHLDVGARVSSIYYFNRDHISSGPQSIDAPCKNDLSLQVRYRF